MLVPIGQQVIKRSCVLPAVNADVCAHGQYAVLRTGGSLGYSNTVVTEWGITHSR